MDSQLNRNQPVTLHDILRILRLHVSVPQCDIFGYLSIDSEIVILVVPVDQKPTPLQVQQHRHGSIDQELTCVCV